ncbi:MAG: hypothetical protein ACO20H_10630 [Bacteriovoracaceae bacterium]
MNKVVLLLCFIFTSCAELFYTRRHLEEMEHETDGFFVAGRDFPQVPGDTGKGYRSKADIRKRTPSSDYESALGRRKNSIKSELSNKEEKLSLEEYRRYKENEDYFQNESEKIYYLGLPLADRLHYLTSKRRVIVNPSVADQTYYDTKNDFNRSVFVGMNKNSVIQSWGRPERVEVAGDPQHENERWTFYDRGRVQLIFFEKGRVQGWSVE